MGGRRLLARSAKCVGDPPPATGARSTEPCRWLRLVRWHRSPDSWDAASERKRQETGAPAGCPPRHSYSQTTYHQPFFVPESEQQVIYLRARHRRLCIASRYPAFPSLQLSHSDPTPGHSSNPVTCQPGHPIKSTFFTRAVPRCRRDHTVPHTPTPCSHAAHPALTLH